MQVLSLLDIEVSPVPVCICFRVQPLHVDIHRHLVASWLIILGAGVDYVAWQRACSKGVLQALRGEMCAKGICYQKQLLLCKPLTASPAKGSNR